MLETLRQRTVATVLFDEAHGEAWSIRPEAAARMRPEHPAAASYAARAGELAERDFEVAATTGGRWTTPRWPTSTCSWSRTQRGQVERTIGGDSPCSRPRRSPRWRASWPAAAGSSCSARKRRTSTAATSASSWRGTGSRRERDRLRLPARRRRAPWVAGEGRSRRGATPGSCISWMASGSTAPASWRPTRRRHRTSHRRLRSAARRRPARGRRQWAARRRRRRLGPVRR